MAAHGLGDCSSKWDNWCCQEPNIHRIGIIIWWMRAPFYCRISGTECHTKAMFLNTIECWSSRYALNLFRGINLCAHTHMLFLNVTSIMRFPSIKGLWLNYGHWCVCLSACACFYVKIHGTSEYQTIFPRISYRSRIFRVFFPLSWNSIERYALH